MKIPSKLYILPGWGHRLSDPYYQQLIKIASKQYIIPPLKFQTRNSKRSLGVSEPFSVVVKNLDAQIQKPCNKDTILGFSIGALLAYQLSTRHHFAHTVLCSIAPCLGEDMRSYQKKELKDFSEVQYQEMCALDYAPLRAQKVSVLYGEKEAEMVKKRSRAIVEENRGALIEVKGADHDFDAEYLREIEKLLG